MIMNVEVSRTESEYPGPLSPLIMAIEHRFGQQTMRSASRVFTATSKVPPSAVRVPTKAAKIDLLVQFLASGRHLPFVE